MFIENSTDALRDAAANLFIDEQRIDDAAAVVHDPEPQYLDHAGFDVDLDEAAHHAVGSQVGETLRNIVPCGGQFRATTRRQLVLPKVGNVRQLRKRHCLGSCSAAKSAV